MFPPAPPFGTLRLAKIDDIPRIAVVATSGFVYSPIFGWERRYHHEFPEDTLNSYKKKFADMIRNLEFIVLVVEDSYESNEHTKTKAAISTDADALIHQSGERVIVGVAAWKLAPNSKRLGQFMDLEDLASINRKAFDPGLERDKDMSHALQLYELSCTEEEKYFKDHMIVWMVVVHPAYWRRGYGKMLVKWGLELAAVDGVKSGVYATNVGEGLYLSLGFVRVGEMNFKDEEQPPNEAWSSILSHDA